MVPSVDVVVVVVVDGDVVEGVADEPGELSPADRDAECAAAARRCRGQFQRWDPRERSQPWMPEGATIMITMMSRPKTAFCRLAETPLGKLK